MRLTDEKTKVKIIFIASKNMRLLFSQFIYIYSDAYILVSGCITVEALAADRGDHNIQIILKVCAPFTDCISELNNT